jgi:probable HAF family extracellular repeat protein
MKHQKLFCLGAILLLLTRTIIAQTSAQQSAAGGKHHHYKLIDLGTFGGPQSYVYVPANYAPVLNNQGTVAGWADTLKHDHYPKFCFNEDCFVSHTFQTQNGKLTDLGALKPRVSSAPGWISPNGLIAGVSENGETDPLVPGFAEFRAVLWQDGNIHDLGTLPEGGYESAANAVDSGGLVIGLATNTTPDSNSIFGLGYETRAFRWDNQNGMQDLGTLGSGTDAEALLVNERGQIVGVSYTNSSPSTYCAQNLDLFLTTGAFLWQKGKMKDLGNFGGTCTVPTDLNEQGQVTGISTVSGDQFQHAFLWSDGSLNDLPNALGGHNASAIALNNTGEVTGWASLPGDQTVHGSLWKNSIMTDLGTVDGDQCSVGSSINATGQIIGVSAPACDFSLERAFLWERHSIADLNTLIPPGSPLYLTNPETINDRGEIAGVGFDSSNNQHAFLLTPCDENHPGIEGCDYSMVDTNAAARVPPLPHATKQSSFSQRTNRNRIPILGSNSSHIFSLEDREADSLRMGYRESTAGRCSRAGWQCAPRILPPCCPGLQCELRGDRAYCERQGSKAK